MNGQSKSIPILDRSSVGGARRSAMQAAGTFGFDEEQRSDIGIVVTEAANNMVLHAAAGEVLLCPALDPQGSVYALDLLSLDKGPGIDDVGRARQDGFSTLGTAGQGLGAIDRQSQQTEMYTQVGGGTALWSRFLLDPTRAPSDPAATFGAVNVPVKGEHDCGDSFLVVPAADRVLYMVVDGLGHGPAARRAAVAAVEIVREYAHEPPAEIVGRAHDALRSTRGAAVALAAYSPEKAQITYAAVGNITSTLTSGATTRSMVSQNGTLGVVLPRTVQEYTYPCPAGASLLMFSDGLNSRCGFNGYAGLATRHPQLIAGVLYRDFSRGRDDATILAARLGGRRS